MKFRKRAIIFLSVIILLAIIILPKIDFSGDDVKNENDGGISGSPLSVEGKIIRPEPLQQRIFTNGTLIGNEEVQLRSETSGKVTDILFEEGRKVKKGDLLIKINDAELRATLKKNLIKVEFAKDRESRAKQLLEKQLTSQQEYDIFLNELNTLEADIEYTNALIAKTEIRAPFDGIIGLRSVSIGSYITPQSPVATLQSINPIKIDFAVPQKYFNNVSEGKEIEFKLPNTDKIFKGKIYAVEPKIDQTTRTILVRAIGSNREGLLSPGAYVEIDIVLSNLNNAMLVPTDALVPDIMGQKVFLYKHGKAVPALVTAGIRTEENIQIISGLKYRRYRYCFRYHSTPSGNPGYIKFH